jgi:hypothetical protein
MDVKDYCGSMSTELTAWKAKMYDITRRLDKMGSAEKEKVLSQVEDMHILITEMGDRIDKLNRECPSEWSPDKTAIDGAHVDMRSKYESTMEFIGKAAPVSVPG